jgi:iron(III) transport system ATP-binding protein
VTSLTLTGVTKAYGTNPVLTGVDLHVPARSLTAVLGPSGCGKTTLLRLVAGFDDPDAGTIALGGDVVAGAGRTRPPQHRRVGYVPQEGALFPHLSVGANVLFGLPRRARTDAGRWLELVGLPADLVRRHPHELSGGQQQRVALARALAPEPSIVLLDEPFSSLDAGLRESTRRAVADALTAAGATAVLVTHDQAEALSLADQVAVMRSGQLVQLAAPEVLYQSPSDAGVAGFVGDAVLLPASVAGGHATCELGSLPVRGAADGPARILLRPEQLILTTTGIEAQVRDVSYFGHDAAVRLELVGGTEVLARVAGHDRPAPGSTVHLTVTGEAVAYPA